MASRKGLRNFSRKFKTKVARDALRDVETVSSIASRHGVHSIQVREWRQQAEAGMAGLFGADADTVAKWDATIKDIHAKIGELTMEKIFLPRLRELSHAERRSLIDWRGDMSISHQCRVLGISRRSAYDAPRPVPQKEVLLAHQGALSLAVNGCAFTLAPGDVMSVPVDLPRRYANEGDALCEVYVVDGGDAPQGFRAERTPP